ncbi:MAG: major capsid protein V20 domain-containing protein, partial [Candidatus Fonsibacter sp.]
MHVADAASGDFCDVAHRGTITQQDHACCAWGGGEACRRASLRRLAEPVCRPDWGQSDDNGAFNEPQTRTIYSSSIKLTCIPDKIVVCVRKNIGGLMCSDTDSYATIKNISINFNNQAGLLSSMTPEQLYRNSVKSGL